MIKIERFIFGEEQLIEKMIKEVYDDFVAPDYTEEGNYHFYDFIKADHIVERVKKGNIIFTAKDEDKIIGIIELQEHNHICLLFVSKTHHRLGIAAKLFNAVLQIIYGISEISSIDVNSSLYAVSVYLKLGFKVMDKIQEVNGIKFIPMRYDVSHTSIT
jgi:GNAT superfamily N-acetyltransferase